MERGEISGFVIQREDAAWFAGLEEECVANWPTERERRYVFMDGKRAMEVLARLQDEGHQVRLFALI